MYKLFIMKKLIVLALCAALQAATATAQDGEAKVPFNGVITDAANLAVRKAHVYTTDPGKYAVSDKKGRFGLTNVRPDDTLHVVVKKKTYVIPVDGRKSALIILTDKGEYTAQENKEIADMGYGFVKRREILNATSNITGEELVKTGKTNLMEALQGKVAGLYIGTPDQTGESSHVSIRGLSSNNPQPPLYIIDGTIVDTLSGIDLHSIDYVEVLKDSNMYGSRGGSGAIVVHTKK